MIRGYVSPSPQSRVKPTLSTSPIFSNNGRRPLKVGSNPETCSGNRRKRLQSPSPQSRVKPKNITFIRTTKIVVAVPSKSGQTRFLMTAPSYSYPVAVPSKSGQTFPAITSSTCSSNVAVPSKSGQTLLKNLAFIVILLIFPTRLAVDL